MLALLAAVVLTLSPVVTSLLVGAILPVAIGALTHWNAAAKVKAVVSIGLSLVAALVLASRNELGGATFTEEAILEFVLVLVANVATFLGFWQPLVDIDHKTFPEFGIGKPKPYPLP